MEWDDGRKVWGATKFLAMVVSGISYNSCGTFPHNSRTYYSIIMEKNPAYGS